MHDLIEIMIEKSNMVGSPYPWAWPGEGNRTRESDMSQTPTSNHQQLQPFWTERAHVQNLLRTRNLTRPPHTPDPRMHFFMSKRTCKEKVVVVYFVVGFLVWEFQMCSIRFDNGNWMGIIKLKMPSFEENMGCNTTKPTNPHPSKPRLIGRSENGTRNQRHTNAQHATKLQTQSRCKTKSKRELRPEPNSYHAGLHPIINTDEYCGMEVICVISFQG